MSQKFRVNEDQIRIDAYIQKHILKNVARGKIQKAIEDEIILINGKPVKSSYKMKFTDELEIPESMINGEKEEFKILPEKIKLDILFEDEDILVVNKPRGMVMHPSEGKDLSGTLVNALLGYLGPEKLSYIETERPGIVHRIDKYTSGIVVCAKNNNSHDILKKQFEEHTIQRIYLTIVENWMSKDSDTIDAPIGHLTTNHKDKKSAYTTSKDGKNMKKAITHWKSIQQYTFKNRKLNLLECKLETGRTHQIRVHLSSLSRFVVGDSLYGPKKSSQLFDLEGPLLHAKYLAFDHPKTNKLMKFEVETPTYFTDILKKLKKEEEYEKTDPME